MAGKYKLKQIGKDLAILEYGGEQIKLTLSRTNAEERKKELDLKRMRLPPPGEGADMQHGPGRAPNSYGAR